MHFLFRSRATIRGWIGWAYWALIFSSLIYHSASERTPNLCTHHLGWPSCSVSALFFYWHYLSNTFFSLLLTSDTLFDILLISSFSASRACLSASSLYAIGEK